jgi:hypothetical protein
MPEAPEEAERQEAEQVDCLDHGVDSCSAFERCASGRLVRFQRLDVSEVLEPADDDEPNVSGGQVPEQFFEVALLVVY